MSLDEKDIKVSVEESKDADEGNIKNFQQAGNLIDIDRMGEEEISLDYGARDENNRKVKSKKRMMDKIKLIKGAKEDKEGVVQNVAKGKGKRLGLAIMLKNETLRVETTLKTVVGVVDSIIVLDTGSTDDTIEKVTRFCEENKMELHLTKKEFEDYSRSRNTLLRFADNKADYLLLLDCNDELREGKRLRKFVDYYKDNCVGFFLTQSWYNGVSLDEYMNVRLIKTGHNWKFYRPIHEFIMCPKAVRNTNAIGTLPIKIFQDRTKDDDKSKNRFPRDRKWLFNEIRNKPEDARSHFYLAQTLMCLQMNSLSWKYYRMRTTMFDFPEEIYHAFYHCGRLGLMLNHTWGSCLESFQKAYRCLKRVEPILEIIKYYIREKNYELAYQYGKQSLTLEVPLNCMLFVNKRAYSYERYAVFCIAAMNHAQTLFHKGEKEKAILKLDEAEINCKKAIAVEPQEKDNHENLETIKKFRVQFS